MGDHLGSVLESSDSDVSTDDGSKELLEERQPAPTSQQRIKSFLRKNWRNVLVLVCLWIAFSLCTAAFSLIAPFFPKEVCFVFDIMPRIRPCSQFSKTCNRERSTGGHKIGKSFHL